MKLPVKDDKTVPWMDETEIPAVKAALSAWRRLRRDRAWRRQFEAAAAGYPPATLRAEADEAAATAADCLAELAAIDGRLRAENGNGESDLRNPGSTACAHT